MILWLAHRLMRAASALMPAHRREWSNAMRVEACVMDDPREALDFALGCLLAAAQERITPMKSPVFIGRLGVGAVTAAFAAFHLQCLANLVAIAMGGPDPYTDMLIRHHHLEAAAAQQAALPYLMLYLLAMGVGKLAAAIFLISRRARPFIWACVSVGLADGGIIAYLLLTRANVGGPLSWVLQFLPLSLLAAAGWVLWRFTPRSVQSLSVPAQA